VVHRVHQGGAVAACARQQNLGRVGLVWGGVSKRDPESSYLSFRNELLALTWCQAVGSCEAGLSQVKHRLRISEYFHRFTGSSKGP
jgi:hypothetical protein